jgi:hypothetical protein
MIVIAGDIASFAVGNFAGRVRKAIPNAFAASIFMCRAFDLVAGRSAAPDKLVWEYHG